MTVASVPLTLHTQGQPCTARKVSTRQVTWSLVSKQLSILSEVVNLSLFRSVEPEVYL